MHCPWLSFVPALPCCLSYLPVLQETEPGAWQCQPKLERGEEAVLLPVPYCQSLPRVTCASAPLSTDTPPLPGHMQVTSASVGQQDVSAQSPPSPQIISILCSFMAVLSLTPKALFYLIAPLSLYY